MVLGVGTLECDAGRLMLRESYRSSDHRRSWPSTTIQRSTLSRSVSYLYIASRKIPRPASTPMCCVQDISARQTFLRAEKFAPQGPSRCLNA